MAAPVNFKVPFSAHPNARWNSEAQRWTDLNANANGNPEFLPLTIKSAYVFGIIHDLCESVEILLDHPQWRDITYLPAYGVFASAIELLGRCLSGNVTPGPEDDLQTGFRWLASANNASADDTIISTPSKTHTVPQLVALRHFAAHGQGADQVLVDIDLDLLHCLLGPLTNGLERYWNILRTDERYCDLLARANIGALRFWPVRKSWVMFQGVRGNIHPSVTDIWSSLIWPGDTA